MAGKKRLLVVSQHYWPENFRITDICEGFAAGGFEVDVLCGIPNYPKGEWFEGYGPRGPRREERAGVQIFRAREVRRRGNTALRIFLNYVAFPLCALVNLLTTPSFWWWLFVATGIGYLWLAVPHLFRKGGNAGGKLLMQVVCIALLQTALDAEIGWQGWSVTYALPATCCAGIVGVLVIILCNRTNWARYVLYQAALAALGFVPLALYAAGAAGNFVMALVPACLAAVSLLVMAVFGDRSIKNEFKRRLRF